MGGWWVTDGWIHDRRMRPIMKNINKVTHFVYIYFVVIDISETGTMFWWRCSNSKICQLLPLSLIWGIKGRQSHTSTALLLLKTNSTEGQEVEQVYTGLLMSKPPSHLHTKKRCWKQSFALWVHSSTFWGLCLLAYFRKKKKTIWLNFS